MDELAEVRARIKAIEFVISSFTLFEVKAKRAAHLRAHLGSVQHLDLYFDLSKDQLWEKEARMQEREARLQEMELERERVELRLQEKKREMELRLQAKEREMELRMQEEEARLERKIESSSTGKFHLL